MSVILFFNRKFPHFEKNDWFPIDSDRFDKPIRILLMSKKNYQLNCLKINSFEAKWKTMWQISFHMTYPKV